MSTIFPSGLGSRTDWSPPNSASILEDRAWNTSPQPLHRRTSLSTEETPLSAGVKGISRHLSLHTAPGHAQTWHSLRRHQSLTSRLSDRARHSRYMSDDYSDHSGHSTPVKSPTEIAHSPWSPTIDERKVFQSTARSDSPHLDMAKLTIDPAVVSPAPLSSSKSPNRKVALTPLLTSPEVLNPPADQPADVCVDSPEDVKGPSSAAPYVLPIGHTRDAMFNTIKRTPSMTKGSFTAAPGIGTSRFMSEKTRLVGEGRTKTPPQPSNLSSQIAISAHASPVAQRKVSPPQIPFTQQPPPLYPLNMNINPAWNPSAQPFTAAPPLMSSNTSIMSSNIYTPANQFASPVIQHQAQQLQMLQLRQQQLQLQAAALLQQRTGLNSAVSAPSPGDSATTPIDVPALVALKGYNPSSFNCQPPRARFFVIKSYTEEDVFKSIKFEIWSSTNPGNNRLDKAFKESADQGPIYLLFSVNASGHFCGIAEMLTPLDYTVTSNVWAQDDKWKGVFKVRWLFIKDTPNSALRHIKLTNTPEVKAVTSSRDTQEVPYAQGCEMLSIISRYNSTTTLLQDMPYYTQLAAQQEQTKGKPQNVVPFANGSPPTRPQRLQQQQRTTAVR